MDLALFTSEWYYSTDPSEENVLNFGQWNHSITPNPCVKLTKWMQQKNEGAFIYCLVLIWAFLKAIVYRLHTLHEGDTHERIKTYYSQFEQRIYSLLVRWLDGKVTMMMKGYSKNFLGKNLSYPTFFKLITCMWGNALTFSGGIRWWKDPGKLPMTDSVIDAEPAQAVLESRWMSFSEYWAVCVTFHLVFFICNFVEDQLDC